MEDSYCGQRSKVRLAQKVRPLWTLINRATTIQVGALPHKLVDRSGHQGVPQPGWCRSHHHFYPRTSTQRKKYLEKTYSIPWLQNHNTNLLRDTWHGHNARQRLPCFEKRITNERNFKNLYSSSLRVNRRFCIGIRKNIFLKKNYR